MSPTRAARSASSQPALAGDARRDYIQSVRAEYRKVAEAHERSEADKLRVPLAKARANALEVDWSAYRPPTPTFLGPRVFEWNDLADLARYIDWTPFFQTWELKGRYPAILDDPEAGSGGAQLCSTTRKPCSSAIIDEKWFTPKAVVGFWPAAQVGDDIRLFADEARATPVATLFTLRQQLSAPRRAAECRARRFRRARVERRPRLCRRLRRHRRHRGGRHRQALRARQRRLFVDHGQGAGRPLRRSLRRSDARARAPRALGLRA